MQLLIAVLNAFQLSRNPAYTSPFSSSASDPRFQSLQDNYETNNKSCHVLKISNFNNMLKSHFTSLIRIFFKFCGMSLQ